MSTHNVSVNLQLIYDPRSSRAFLQMATEAAKASKAANKAVLGEFGHRSNALSEVGGIASKLGMYGTANSLGRTGAFAEGLQGLGMTGAAKFAQRAAIPLAVASQALQATETLANLAHDRYSTNEQLGRRAFREMVPGGERIQRFADAVTGRAAGYEAADIRSQRQSAYYQQQQQQFRSELGLNPALAGSYGAQAFYGRSSAVAPAVINRSTAEGERAFREQQRILPLKQEEAKAEKAMMVASRERLQTGKELFKVAEYGRKLVRERAALEEKLKLPEYQSGVKRQDVLTAIDSKLKAEAENAGTTTAASEKYWANYRAEAEAKGELGKARVRTGMIGQAENLEARADTAANVGRTLGGMTKYDRQYAVQAAIFIKNRGSVEGLPAEFVSAAQSVAGETIGKIMQKTGIESDEYKMLHAAGIDEAGIGDPEAARMKAAALRKGAAEIDFKLDASVQAQISASFEAAGRDMAKIIQLGLDRMNAEITNRILLGRNPVGG